MAMVVHRITMPDPLRTQTCRCWRTFFFFFLFFLTKRHAYRTILVRLMSLLDYFHCSPPMICTDACLLMRHTEVDELIGGGPFYKDTAWSTHTFVPNAICSMLINHGLELRTQGLFMFSESQFLILIWSDRDKPLKTSRLLMWLQESWDLLC